MASGFWEPWSPQVGDRVTMRISPESRISMTAIGRVNGCGATVVEIGSKYLAPYRCYVRGDGNTFEGWCAVFELEPQQRTDAPAAASGGEVGQ